MPVETADKTTREAIRDIFTIFMFTDWQDDSLATLLDQVSRKYGPSYVDHDQLDAVLNKYADVALRDQHRFLYLEPTESGGIMPLVTLQSSCEWIHFRIYALLTMLDECSNLQALAMRFETDEGDHRPEDRIGSHDFFHAQLCNSINDRTPASTPTWIPDSQPSIPLDADNQIGLVLCMLTSPLRRRLRAEQNHHERRQEPSEVLDHGSSFKGTVTTSNKSVRRVS